jgi:hypothetical protein
MKTGDICQTYKRDPGNTGFLVDAGKVRLIKPVGTVPHYWEYFHPQDGVMRGFVYAADQATSKIDGNCRESHQGEEKEVKCSQFGCWNKAYKSGLCKKHWRPNMASDKCRKCGYSKADMIHIENHPARKEEMLKEGYSIAEIEQLFRSALKGHPFEPSTEPSSTKPEPSEIGPDTELIPESISFPCECPECDYRWDESFSLRVKDTFPNIQKMIREHAALVSERDALRERVGELVEVLKTLCAVAGTKDEWEPKAWLNAKAAIDVVTLGNAEATGNMVEKLADDLEEAGDGVANGDIL